jgi:hypothetical protein
VEEINECVGVLGIPSAGLAIDESLDLLFYGHCALSTGDRDT